MGSRYLSAALFGLAVLAGAAVPVTAQSLRVNENSTAETLSVAVNRAVVVESTTPFAEISIANPEIADISTLSERSVYVLGKAPGRTSLTLLGADGRLMTNVVVRVTPDLSELKERLRAVLPGEPVEVRSANDGIVLSGQVSSPQAVDRAMDLAGRYAPQKVSNLMTVGGSQQVSLKVRFAEMSRSVTKALSSSLAIGDSSGNFGAAFGTGDFTAGNNLSNALDNDPSTSVQLTGESEGVFSFGIGAGSFQLQLAIEALESKGFVRTLAEPTLSALSGQNASFLAGGEFPVPAVDDDGDIDVEFKEFGVRLGFTPRVVGGNINLRLSASVSSIDPTVSVESNNISITGFSTRSTSTTVELQDGESFAVAGLLQDDFRAINGQVPWIGDVPVLGALFRSADYAREKTELVIIITAHLVTPTRGEALALPNDRIGPPTENSLFLFGNVSAARSGAAGEVARQDFSGPYGYVME